MPGVGLPTCLLRFAVVETLVHIKLEFSGLKLGSKPELAEAFLTSLNTIVINLDTIGFFLRSEYLRVIYLDSFF